MAASVSASRAASLAQQQGFDQLSKLTSLRLSTATTSRCRILVNCTSQAEIDRYWNALLENGGKPQACGWIIDKYGVRWQIVPTALGEMIADSDETKAKRAAEEMLKQVKFDIAKLEAAFQGGR
jgi:predicted 3-demethylubiquinone-9 3-methyltransferase (glyoxalase superfamily)